MCGRYESWVDDDEVTAILEMEKQGSAARYLKQTEVFPGTVQPVLYGSRIRVRAHLSKWGLTANLFAGKAGKKDGRNQAGQMRLKDPTEPDELSLPASERGAGAGSRTFINARAETAAEKPGFASAFHDGGADGVRRVIVPTSAYYEWSGGMKYRIADGAGALLFLAALEEDDGDLLRENAADPSRVYASFSSSASVFAPMTDGAVQAVSPVGKAGGNPGRRHVILTTEAAGEPAKIHSRMPLFLGREECEGWLWDPDFARERLVRPRKDGLRVMPA